MLPNDRPCEACSSIFLVWSFDSSIESVVEVSPCTVTARSPTARPSRPEACRRGIHGRAGSNVRRSCRSCRSAPRTARAVAQPRVVRRRRQERIHRPSPPAGHGAWRSQLRRPSRHRSVRQPGAAGRAGNSRGPWQLRAGPRVRRTVRRRTALARRRAGTATHRVATGEAARHPRLPPSTPKTSRRRTPAPSSPSSSARRRGVAWNYTDYMDKCWAGSGSPSPLRRSARVRCCALRTYRAGTESPEPWHARRSASWSRSGRPPAGPAWESPCDR